MTEQQQPVQETGDQQETEEETPNTPVVSVQPNDSITVNPQSQSQTMAAAPSRPELDGLRKELADVRKEAAKYRTERNQYTQQLDAFKDSIAKALGLKEDEQASAEQVSGQLNDMTSKYRSERIKNAFYVEAYKQGADVDLAWAHLYASGALNGIDVDGDDFQETVGAQLGAALEKHPKLKADYKPPELEQEKPRNVGSGSNPGGQGDSHPEDELFQRNPYSLEHRNLTKQGQIERDTPDLAQRLQKAAGRTF
jgi:hypothetical protein